MKSYLIKSKNGGIQADFKITKTEIFNPDLASNLIKNIFPDGNIIQIVEYTKNEKGIWEKSKYIDLRNKKIKELKKRGRKPKCTN